jgi:very-short-patch-repair endonuclease
MKFHRQYQIFPFIVDFCCLERRLIVELDGGQHSERHEYDESRSQYLQRLGFTIIRFWNNEVVNDIDAVLERIVTPHPSPLPASGARGKITRR